MVGIFPPHNKKKWIHLANTLVVKTRPNNTSSPSPNLLFEKPDSCCLQLSADYFPRTLQKKPGKQIILINSDKLGYGAQWSEWSVSSPLSLVKSYHVLRLLHYQLVQLQAFAFRLLAEDAAHCHCYHWHKSWIYNFTFSVSALQMIFHNTQ